MGNYYETFNPPFFLDLSFRPDLLKSNRDGYNRAASDILNDIKDGLRLLNPLTAPQLIIHTEGQTVFLSGSVPTKAMARFIADLANNTLGVRKVENSMVIQRAGASSERNLRPSHNTPSAWTDKSFEKRDIQIDRGQSNL